MCDEFSALKARLMDQTILLVGKTERYQKLASVLVLLKKGEVILNIFCGRSSQLSRLTNF
jgi:hypothetical protein